MRLTTQWRVGMGGISGLDYLPLFALLDRVTQSREEWDEMLDDVRVLESAALRAMKAKND